MLAHWHLGPITGFHFWWILVTSPEVLVFLFFMITDPKTAPQAPRARLLYGLALGVLAAADDRADDDRVREQGRTPLDARRSSAWRWCPCASSACRAIGGSCS